MVNGTADVPSDIVLACLGRLDSITDLYLAFLAKRSPTALTLIPEDDLRTYTRMGIEIILRYCNRLPLTDQQTTTPKDWGVYQAKLSIPLDIVLLMLRLHEHVIWKSFLTSDNEDAIGNLGDYTLTVWQSCERYLLGVQHGYLAERARIAQGDRVERDGVIRALFATDGKDVSVTRQAAAALRARTGEPWIVAVGDGSQDIPFMKDAALLASYRCEPYILSVSDRPTLITQASTTLQHVGLGLFKNVRCGIAEAESLDGVPSAYQVAREVLESLPDEAQGPWDQSNAWLFVLTRRAQQTGLDSPEFMLSALRDTTQSNSGRLLDTFIEYARTGSVNDVAKSLGCHRNTILNRLKEITRLTGFDPTIPSNAASLLTLLGYSGESILDGVTRTLPLRLGSLSR